MTNHANIPVFIPHIGCPKGCVFCSQNKITGTEKIPTVDDVVVLIEKSLKNLNGRMAEVAFFGGSFTGIPLHMQTEYLEAVLPYIKSGKISGIRLSTRPDYINKKVLENLKKYNVTCIELGAQSMCDDVLMASDRGHTAQDTENASNLIKSYGFELGLQMMIGLPKDSPEKSVFTASEIVRLGADYARIYPTCVIYNTALYDMCISGKYSPLNLDEAVDTAAKVYRILSDGGVNVIRCGLQATDTLGEDIYEGPYHPAFGEMVKSRIKRDEMEEKIRLLLPEKEIKFKVPANKISQFVGQKRSNILFLEEKYKIKIRMEQLK